MREIMLAKLEQIFKFDIRLFFERKSEVKLVVSFCRNGGEHGGLPIHLKIFSVLG